MAIIREVMVNTYCAIVLSGNHFGKLTRYNDLDYATPGAHELGSILQAGHIAQQNRWSADYPRRRRDWYAWYGGKNAECRYGSGCNNRI